MVLERAQAVLGSTLERHGGKLSASMGQHIVGVFGVPTLHEDDALRAAQAALAAQGALEAEAAALAQERGLALRMQVGQATGEALVGGPDPSGFAGDAVGQAVELAELAAAGEILVSDQTRRLAAGAVEVEPAGDGRFRLLAAPIGARPLAVRLDAPLVGRGEELARLREGLAGRCGRASRCWRPCSARPASARRGRCASWSPSSRSRRRCSPAAAGPTVTASPSGRCASSWSRRARPTDPPGAGGAPGRRGGRGPGRGVAGRGARPGRARNPGRSRDLLGGPPAAGDAGPAAAAGGRSGGPPLGRTHLPRPGRGRRRASRAGAADGLTRPQLLERRPGWAPESP